MDTATLVQKIQRLHAAVGSTEDRDISKYLGLVIKPGEYLARQDFSGGLGDPEIHNLAAGVIRSISDLRDHLKVWAAANGRDKGAVDSTIKQCQELALIMDLANFDKHGKHDREGGWSGKAPQLKDVKRYLTVTGDARSVPFGLRPSALGGLEPFGGDGGKVIVSGDVVLNDGKILSLMYLQQKAIEAWQRLFQQFGI
jgi:hypothetical protein